MGATLRGVMVGDNYLLPWVEVGVERAQIRVCPLGVLTRHFATY